MRGAVPAAASSQRAGACRAAINQRAGEQLACLAVQLHVHRGPPAARAAAFRARPLTHSPLSFTCHCRLSLYMPCTPSAHLFIGRCTHIPPSYLLHSFPLFALNLFSSLHSTCSTAFLHAPVTTYWARAAHAGAARGQALASAASKTATLHRAGLLCRCPSAACTLGRSKAQPGPRFGPTSGQAATPASLCALQALLAALGDGISSLGAPWGLACRSPRRRRY